MMRNVWAYWQQIKDRSKPVMIDICHQSMLAHQTSGEGYDLEILSENNLNKFLKDIPDIFFKFPWYCSGAFQADYLRVRLLYEYGGVYLDSDTLVMEELDSFFDLLERYDSVFFRSPHGAVSNAVILSRPGSKIMGAWLDSLHDIFSRAPNEPNDQGGILPCAWGGLGEQIICPLTNSGEFQNIKVLAGADTIYPINWDVQEQVYLQDDPDKILYNKYKKEMQPVLVLAKTLYEAIEREKIDLENIRNSSRLISNFIKSSNDASNTSL